MSFWSELKRRNVVKVGVAYAIVAWLLIQGADIIFPHLNLPSWAVTFLIVFLIIGFPLALLFAWAFEITPDGIKLTKEVPRAESITHITGRKLNYVLAGLLILAVSYIVIDKYFITPRAVETERAAAVSDLKVAQKTIAIVPFVNLSPDPDQEYFVDGLSEELLNSLTNIPDLRVTARTSSFTFKGSDKTVQEIASVLGVENILEGSVRKADSMLRVTAQLVRASDGFHLWSKTYDRELKDIFAVQEDIATAVADELKATLGIGTSLKQLGGTNIAEAYEHYLVAQGQYKTFKPENALESINAALALDPECALAWALKSNIHNGIVAKGVSSDPIAEHDAALSAAERAIEVAPNLPTGYYSLGFLKTCTGDWIGAETAYRKAVELTTDSSLKYKVVHPYHYLSVGNFERAKELLESALRDDPLNTRDRAAYIQCLVDLGDMRRAKKENERCRALFGDQWADNDLSGWWLAPIDNEDFVSNNPKLMQSLKDSCLYLLDDNSREQFQSPKEVLDKLRQCFSEPENQCCYAYDLMWCAAFLGDPELAINGMEQGIRIDASSTHFIWGPLFREMRQLPRFKELVKKIGLVAYWNKFGWPDICRPLDNDDFVCD